MRPRRVLRAARIVAVVPVLLAGTACYEYHDAPLSAVRVDATVHVVLSSAAATSLAPTIGPNATELDGRVLSVGADTMRLALTQIARVAGQEEFVHDEPIDVPAKGALSISTRSFDHVRTVLAVAAILAGAFVAHAATNQPGIVSVKGGPSGSTK